MVRGVVVLAAIIFMAASPCSAAANDCNPYAEAGKTGYADFSQPTGYSVGNDTRELDNARRLVLLLSKARTGEDLSVFFEATNAFCSGFKNEFTRYVRLFLTMINMAPDPSPLLKKLQLLLSAINYTHVAINATNELLKYQRATTPRRLTYFYAEAEGATKIVDARGRAIAWQMAAGSHHRLAFKVAVEIPGTTARMGPHFGPVITPAGIATKILHAIRLDKAGVDSQLYSHLKGWVRSAVQAGMRQASQHVASRHILDYGFRLEPAWLESEQDRLDLPTRNYGPFDVGDVRSIAIDRNFNHGVIQLVAPDRLHYGVFGRSKGETAFFAKFTPFFSSITIDGRTQITERMAFRVVDPAPPAAVAPRPVPQLGQLPPIPSPPAAPKLPDLPPPPAPQPPPNPPPAPSQPAGPGFVICQQNALGEWNYPDKCLPK